jgi:phosphatidylinositol glycan class B
MEAIFMIAALAKWPWKPEWLYKPAQGHTKSDTRTALVFAAIAVMFRPTNMLVWLFVISVHLSTMKYQPQIRFIRLYLIPIVVTAVLVQALLDKWFYGVWTMPMLNFLRMNFFQVRLNSII